MRMMMKTFVIATAAIVAMPVGAVTLVSGTGTGSNNFPFSAPFGSNSGSRYQQVYAATQFSGPININSVSFRRINGTTLTTGIHTLGVSTTAAAVNGLSSIFNSNVGANNQTVFSGALAGLISGSTLTFNFSSPFAYNPGSGNLLLDFQIASTGRGNSAFAANNGDAGGVYSRQHDFGTATSGYGLQTTFDFSPASAVPEPATWAMMIGGFGIVGMAMRRRRRMTVSYS